MGLGWAPGSAIGATGGHHRLVMTLSGTCGTREWARIRGRGNHRICMGIARDSWRGSKGTALSIRKAERKGSGDNSFEGPSD